MDTAHGRYLVLTASGSLYEIDLDQKTLCRRPSPGDLSQDTLRRDGQNVELLELRECTVGRRMIVVIDLRWERVPSTTRVSTPVIVITAAPNIDMTFIDLRSGGSDA
jgi:hypothetical protein